jgi:SAM-dependent methyltransferase
MQQRQTNRRQYFDELALTSERYFLPYVESQMIIDEGTTVLEIGCGDGGNLLPFARRGCEVTGVDIATKRIEDARTFFADAGVEGRFIASDIFKLKELEHTFDLIFCHDVLEHIPDKRTFLHNLRRYLSLGGKVFMSFPAWQMPFGGHQQICHNRLLSHLPFLHLLPRALYRLILKAGGEKENCIRELLEIKTTKLPIERFELLARLTELRIVHRQFYFINPHYETKFGLRPRKLPKWMSHIPYLRNYFTTSCFYLLEDKHPDLYSPNGCIIR